MRVGVDVDLTVVRSDRAWWEWLNSIYGPPTVDPKSTGTKKYYNLSKYWPNEDPNKLMDFWRKENLYDNLAPMYDSVECLNILNDAGCKIIFISSIKGNHNKSKYYFLKKYFPFMAGYIATKEKWLVDVDVMVDDRDTNLLSFDDKVKLFRFASDYYQDCPSSNRIKEVGSWLDCGWRIDDYKNSIGEIHGK